MDTRITWVTRFVRTFLRSPLGILLATLLIIALSQATVIKLYTVPSDSMQPLLNASEPSWGADRILVDRIAYFLASPKPADVIAFRTDQNWQGSATAPSIPWYKSAVMSISETIGIGPGLGDILVKRVIAGPGDKVSCCSIAGDLTVNGVALSEPYVSSNFEYIPGKVDCGTTPMSMRCFPEFVVPENHDLVLGDNRSNSSDSLANCRRGVAVFPDCVRFVDAHSIVGRVWAIIDIPPRPLFVL